MELGAGAFDVADAAELPDELAQHAAAAEADDQFSALWDGWLEHLIQDRVVLLALEQSCSDGVLLPWDMRGARLLRAPPEAVDVLHHFWRTTPAHLGACLSHYVYWLVRAERGVRRGTPYWAPTSALPAKHLAAR